MSGGSAKVRWLCVGTFSGSPAGRRFAVTRDTFGAVLASSSPAVTVQVNDRLGAPGGKRSLSLKLDKLSSMQPAQLVASVPELARLKAFADALVSSENQRKATAESVTSSIEQLVGPGTLLDAFRAATGTVPAEPKAAAPVPASAPTGGDAVERIFSQTDVSGSPEGAKAGAALAAIISTVASTPSTGLSATLGKVRATLMEAIQQMATEALLDAAFTRIESSWRGLKLVLDQCPPGGEVELEAIDGGAADAEAALRGLTGDAVDWPDAAFLLDPCDDVSRLGAIAALGEENNIPVIAAASLELLKKHVGLALEGQETGAVSEEWKALQESEASRWLCVAANGIVVANTAAPGGARCVLCSPAFGIAALLSASFRDVAAFGQVAGPQRGIQAPALRAFTGTRESGSVSPVEAFASVNLQTQLAKVGVAALGSARNGDRFLVSGIPMVRASQDAIGLPAQIMTGRIVRFSMWARDSLPAGTPVEEVKGLMEGAASAVLFAGLGDAARYVAKGVDDASLGRAVVISASVAARLAGQPFSLQFALPLRAA